MKKTAVPVMALIVLLCICLGGCTPGYNDRQGIVSSTGFYFDTVVSVTLYNASQSAADDVLAQCAQYEALFSKTREGSDVWRINHANGVPVNVDHKTAVLLEAVKRISEYSQGAFDVTIEPLMSLWNFSGETHSIPDEKALYDALSRVGYVSLRLNGDTVYLPPNMSIDLGGIAKGYIADELAEYCRQHELYNGILNIGGNVMVMGSKPNKEGYRVGVQDPKKPAGEYIATIENVKGSVATSGDYQRFFELDGVRYHHLIVPWTGMPAQNNLASVTVLTDISMLADAFATAAYVLGPEDGDMFIKSFNDTEAVFVYKDGHIEYTDGLEGRITLAGEK